MNKLTTILEMIKFKHTIFALPFAYIGALVGMVVFVNGGVFSSPATDTSGIWPTWAQIGWITLAMVGARSAAMALNRLIDRYIDARNPRTKERAIPAGKLNIVEVILFIIASFTLLFVSAYMLNPLATQLLPIAVFMLVIYSYTKRFTWLCHFVLGMAIGIAPLGGWVGATGTLHIEAVILYVAVICWVAGFDILYSTQDAQYDKKDGLYSIPSYFGISRALWISRAAHTVMVICLFILAAITPLGWIYVLGSSISAVILIYEHSLVRADDLSKVNIAFFVMNGILSVVLFTFVLIDLVVMG